MLEEKIATAIIESWQSKLSNEDRILLKGQIIRGFTMLPSRSLPPYSEVEAEYQARKYRLVKGESLATDELTWKACYAFIKGRMGK